MHRSRCATFSGVRKGGKARASGRRKLLKLTRNPLNTLGNKATSRLPTYYNEIDLALPTYF